MWSEKKYWQKNYWLTSNDLPLTLLLDFTFSDPLYVSFSPFLSLAFVLSISVSTRSWRTRPRCEKEKCSFRPILLSGCCFGRLFDAAIQEIKTKEWINEEQTGTVLLYVLLGSQPYSSLKNLCIVCTCHVINSFKSLYCTYVRQFDCTYIIRFPAFTQHSSFDVGPKYGTLKMLDCIYFLVPW